VIVMIDRNARQQLQIGNWGPGKNHSSRMMVESISKGPEAVGVSVVVLGKEGDFVMPCWTRCR
jgi:hypothetical protein